MRKSFCHIITIFLLSVVCDLPMVAQSRREFSQNQLGLQYGFSLKGVLELNLRKTLPSPVFRLCANFGVGSSILDRALYFSINGELQLYNGGLGSRKREASKRPRLTVDLINAFTLTTGIKNYLAADSNAASRLDGRNMPLYYFSNFTYPALQNPFDYSLSLGTNYIISSDRAKTNQRVGFINIHLQRFQVSYFNDGGAPFDEIFLGDSRDRFYTGGVLLSYHGNPEWGINLVELSFNKFTGYSKNAFELSNSLDLAFVNYNKTEQKYFNKSVWSLNIANPGRGWGVNLNRHNFTDWDVQHLLHFSIFNSYHLVPYEDYFSVSGTWFNNYSNIGLP